MKRLPNWLVVILAVVLVLGFTLPVMAADTGKEDVARGKIKSIMPDKHQFILTDKNGQDWTFRVSKDAKIRHNNKEGQLSDLKEGDEVTVSYGMMINDVLAERTAQPTDITRGRVKNPTPDRNQFILTDVNGKDWTFELAKNAQILQEGKERKLGDLKEGDAVAIAYTKEGERFMANEIFSDKEGTSAEVALGHVQSVSPDSQQLVLKSPKGDQRTFHLSPEARVFVNEKESKLADLKEGVPVTVCYQLRAHAIESNRNE
jgi:hypothetical protein